eukprot:5590350-Amphidinium_carterae.1
MPPDNNDNNDDDHNSNNNSNSNSSNNNNTNNKNNNKNNNYNKNNNNYTHDIEAHGNMIHNVRRHVTELRRHHLYAHNTDSCGLGFRGSMELNIH